MSELIRTPGGSLLDVLEPLGRQPHAVVEPEDAGLAGCGAGHVVLQFGTSPDLHRAGCHSWPITECLTLPDRPTQIVVTAGLHG